jgi:WhiB family transcriptional regulator, redox-sensing transcriptional regulator
VNIEPLAIASHRALHMRPKAPALSLAPPEAWTEAALCAQVDPELFYPEKGGAVRDAKRICAACPVAAECLEYALRCNDIFGVYGGLSPRQRRGLRRGAA